MHILVVMLQFRRSGENKSLAAAGEYREFPSLGITTEDELRVTWWENNSAGE